MAIFKTKITNVRLTLSPFSSEQMAGIGQVMVGVKIDRIKQGLNSKDAPAKPLVERYAKRKIMRNRAPIRDWNWRGLTLGSAKVIAANEDRVTIGFVNPQADQIVTKQRRVDEQWSDSPRDTEALHAVVRQTLAQHRVIAVVKRKMTA